MFTTNVFIALLTLCTLLVAIGCDRMDNQTIDEINEVSVDDNRNNRCHCYRNDTPRHREWDEYIINAATIEDDTLRVNVSYSGGCETHAFTLVAEPRFLESFPVQLRVSIAHNANGDTCEASITEDHVFDLTPIKEAYQTAYRTDHDTIVLRLKDAPPSNLTIRHFRGMVFSYQFETSALRFPVRERLWIAQLLLTGY